MVATVSAPANGGLRPPDVELDLSAEVVVEFALKSKERDAVVTWVPTPSSPPRIPPKASIAGFQSATSYGARRR